MAPSRRLTLDVDLATAAGILRRSDIPWRPIRISRLEGGSTEVYLIEQERAREAPIVLKIHPDSPEWRPGKERLVSGWLDGALDVPVPRVLALDTSRDLLPLRYSLMTALPGSPARSWMTTAGVDQVYRQMGVLLRQMHTIPMPGYGYIRDQGVETPMSSNLEYMTHAFEGAFRRFREAGGDPDLARALEAIASGNMHLTVSKGPVLCHDDLHPGNVLVQQAPGGQLSLSGLIDFGNARAADPLFDLAKAIFCSSHEDARAGVPLREGYGEVDHPNPGAALWLYTMHHRVSMWAFLTRLGHDPDAADGPGGLIQDLGEMARAGRPL